MGLTLFLLSAIFVLGLFACGGVEFKINFIVDGEVYAVVNTNGAETVKMPDNPEKEDYAFDGWFWDKDIWQKPFTANSILDAPLSPDINVYAKWTFTGEITPPEPEPTPETPKPETTEYFNKLPDGTYYGKVYNATTDFDFTGKIETAGEYFVCTDEECKKPLADNKTSLILGDNIFYVLYANGQKTTATVRRRLIYTVNFDSNGGTELSEQKIEEDKKATAPKNPMRVGYTFNTWDRDFNEPITENTTIKALWNANTNTPYKIEYYLQNLEDNNYTLQESDTEYLTGTTDTIAMATKTYEHFTVIENTVSANLSPDGTTVLQVYYTRNKYTVKIFASNNSVSLSNNIFNGEQYKYGYIIPDITANYDTTYNNYLGYEWQGWFIDNGFFTKNFTISSFTVDKNIECCAKGEKEEMSNFIFTATINTCTIIGIKNKMITEIFIPDYVTKIGQSALRGCSSLETITIPDSVTRIEHYAFYDCTSLTSITIGNSVTNIGYFAFYNCNSLKLIIFNTTTPWCRTRNPIEWENRSGTGGTRMNTTTPSTNAYNFTTYFDNYWYKCK